MVKKIDVEALRRGHRAATADVYMQHTENTSVDCQMRMQARANGEVSVAVAEEINLLTNPDHVLAGLVSIYSCAVDNLLSALKVEDREYMRERAVDQVIFMFSEDAEVVREGFSTVTYVKGS